MAVVKRVIGLAKAKAEYNALKTLRDAWQAQLESLSPLQRQNALNDAIATIGNWQAAPAGNKINALGVSVALLYMVVSYIAFRILDDGN